MYSVKMFNTVYEPADPVNMYEYLLINLKFLYAKDARKYIQACIDLRAGKEEVVYIIYDEQGGLLDAYSSKHIR